MEQTDIILQSISKSFGETEVLSHISLTFKAAGAYCLMAPSGAGKTTLLKILMGLLLPDSGSLYGMENKRIAAVFQEDRLLEDASALQNIRFVTGKRCSTACLEEMLSVLLPKDCLNQPVSGFSGGMKRRLSILRALLSPSDIILMDEPFAGLDLENKRKAIDLINRLSKDKLLIVSTHDPEDASLLNAETVTLPVCGAPL